MSHQEMHKSHRTGWLRAAVLGANDGIVSTASLIIGVASAHAARGDILLAGVAGLVAGAMSMAVGEYVSVSSQADAEKADIELEKKSLTEDYDYELEELAEIYERRGLSADLAKQVTQQLMAHDALAAHARDELGLAENVRARPIQAAVFSAGTFTIGAVLPLLVAWNVSPDLLVRDVAIASLLFLATLGGLAAYAGGAGVAAGAARVTFWGAIAMVVTAAAGKLFGVVV
jgi:vacuolar iron transporter family protein